MRTVCLRSNGLAWRPWGATLLVVALVLAIHLTPTLPERLQLDRAGLAAGQFWRILTAHFTHWTLEHLAWDLAAFAGLLALALKISARRTLFVLGAASLGVSLAVWALLPGMTAYRGLSGLDSALFALVAFRILAVDWRRRDRLGVALVMAFVTGFMGKLALEWLTGRALFVQGMGPGVSAVPVAHLVGLLAGIAGCLVRGGANRRGGERAAILGWACE